MPKKKPAEQKGIVIKIRVSKAQKAAIDAACEKDGMDVSTFLRHWALERARVVGVHV
jgi:uncharacterized protein (DUF1778 family)